MRATILLLAGMMMAGCLMAKVSPAGRKVKAVTAPPSSDCTPLGNVVGKSRGGLFVSDRERLQYAMNDAQNKAAERGATHFQAGPAALKESSSADEDGNVSSSTSATVVAAAYKCPSSPATPSPAAAALEGMK